MCIRDRSLSDGEAEENFRDSCVEHDNPESILIDRENVAALENEMKKSLSPLENRVLQLYLDGNGYMDIAQILGKTPKSIDNALPVSYTHLPLQTETENSCRRPSAEKGFLEHLKKKTLRNFWTM